MKTVGSFVKRTLVRAHGKSKRLLDGKAIYKIIRNGQDGRANVVLQNVQTGRLVSLKPSHRVFLVA